MSYRSAKANRARRFNGHGMPNVNNSWAARVLNMQLNPKEGPDLIDDNKVAECKFRLIGEEGYTHISWRVLEHQLAYGKETPAFWALGTYTLTKPIREIKTKDPDILESLVGQRELFLVKWDWMHQFQCYIQTGKTETSEWENHLRFPKYHKLPRTTITYEVEKGFVHLTEGVPRGVFQILDSRAPF